MTHSRNRQVLFQGKQISNFMSKQSVKKFMLFAGCAFICMLYSTAKSQTNMSQTKAQFIPEYAGHTNKFSVYCKLYIYDSSHMSPIHCSIGVCGWTNLTLYRPYKSQAYDAHLFDAASKEVSKTFYGRSFGQPLKADKQLLDGSWRNSLATAYGNSREMSFTNGYGDSYWDIDMIRSFRIKAAGEYRLQVQVRLFTKDTNGVFQPFILPPTETDSWHVIVDRD